MFEGPEAGVYYRGKGKIEKNDQNETSTIITLPEYTKNWYDFTVQITPIINKNDRQFVSFFTTPIENNQFEVFCKNGKYGEFYWTVFAKRHDLNIEPNISDVVIKGDGP